MTPASAICIAAALILVGFLFWASRAWRRHFDEPLPVRAVWPAIVGIPVLAVVAALLWRAP